MISLVPARRANGSLHRRDLLRMGSLGATAMSLTPWWPAQLQATAAFTGTAKNCIFIFLCGGPSQHDLWDLKPDAPEGIRSTFQPIDTNVPGIRFGELIPRVARHADKLAVIRSMTHDDNGHDQGIARSLLGQLPQPRSEVHASRNDHPALGAILHRLNGASGDLPPWVILPRPFTTGGPQYKGQSAGFLGSAYDPIVLDKEKKGSLSDRAVRLDALQLPEGIDRGRFTARLDLLNGPNLAAGGFRQDLHAASWSAEYEKALTLLTSREANQAFDLDREPDSLRDLYGHNEYGQSFLLARRLVESGVRVVNVFWTFFDEKGCQFNLWDNHGVDADTCGVDGQITGIQQLTHDYCCPSFDRAFSALLEDLSQRGLLDETIVAVAGEFGRTFRINKHAGRDHWAPCYSQILAGGGVRGGQIYGASDGVGAYVKDAPVTPDDFMATIFHAFGHSSETMVEDQLNRPIRISQGTPLTALF
ncbi:MAG: DUF1501 domain-containing protein [Pirellulales bacterium]